MSDGDEHTPDLLRDSEFLRFAKEVDPHPIFSAGVVPEGAGAPYVPSVDELIEGARHAAEAYRALAEARATVMEERARMLFAQRTEEER